ncbi:unnamed protein product [Effrenium voratum]|nr:unnamed protein product [Effrenium voratum]
MDPCSTAALARCEGVAVLCSRRWAEAAEGFRAALRCKVFIAAEASGQSEAVGEAVDAVLILGSPERPEAGFCGQTLVLFGGEIGVSSFLVWHFFVLSCYVLRVLVSPLMCFVFCPPLFVFCVLFILCFLLSIYFGLIVFAVGL